MLVTNILYFMCVYVCVHVHVCVCVCSCGYRHTIVDWYSKDTVVIVTPASVVSFPELHGQDINHRAAEINFWTRTSQRTDHPRPADSWRYGDRI